MNVWTSCRWCYFSCIGIFKTGLFLASRKLTDSSMLWISFVFFFLSDEMGGSLPFPFQESILSERKQIDEDDGKRWILSTVELKQKEKSSAAASATRSRNPCSLFLQKGMLWLKIAAGFPPVPHCCLQPEDNLEQWVVHLHGRNLLCGGAP